MKILALILLAIVFSCEKTNDISSLYNSIDIVIENSMIYDGTANKPVLSNIYIKDDKIVFVGKIDHSKVDIRKIIDGTGYITSPGFIDLHSHGDPLKTPEFENFLRMGVTTITLGQDGFSPDIKDLGPWVKSVDSIQPAVNIAMFIGHGTLRNLTGINSRKAVTKYELDEMKSILENNMPYIFGLSTGLEYSPAIYAEESELLELAKVVGKYNRLIMSHMRNEDDDQLDHSIDELIQQGKFASVHISHLKSVYGKGKSRAEEILHKINQARDNGIKITSDVYPYNASYTGISIVFPNWAKTRNQFDEVIQTRRPELVEFIRNKVNKRNGPQATLIGTAPYTGKTLLDLQNEMNKPFEDILIDVIGPGGASGAYFVMNEELQNRLIQDDNVGISSDGSPTMHHPRGHGTFAKVIQKFVVEDSLLIMNQAIQKMTSFAAQVLGLNDRGLIKAGYKADIIMFKPENVKAKATFPNPKQFSVGFDYVIINGQISINDIKSTKVKSGQILKPKD